MDPLTREILLSALPPLFITAILIPALSRLHPAPAPDRPPSTPPSQSLAALAVLLIACLAAHLLAFGWFILPPHSASDAMPLGIIVLFAACATHTLAPRRTRLIWLVTSLLFAAAAALLARNFITRSWPWILTVTNLASISACALIALAGSARAATHHPPRAAALLLLIPATAASLALALGFHTLTVSQMAGIAASILIGLTLASFLTPRLSLRTGIALFPVALVMLALWLARLTAPTPRAWLAIVLITLAFGSPILTRSSQAARTTFAQFALVTAFSTAAVLSVTL